MLIWLWVIFVAEYFYLKNDNNEIVIDDNYHNPTFLYKETIQTSTGTGSPENLWNGKTLPWLGYGSVQYLSWFGVTGKTQKFDEQVFVFYRSQSWTCAVARILRPDTGAIQVRAYSLNQNDVLDIALFHLGQRVASNYGLVLYNEQSEVVFDAMKGFLHVVDNLNIQLNPAGDVQSYWINVNPAIVDINKLYICILGIDPFYVRGGTIVINYRTFYTRLRFDGSSMYLDMVPYGGPASGATVQNYLDSVNIMIAYIPY